MQNIDRIGAKPTAAPAPAPRRHQRRQLTRAKPPDALVKPVTDLKGIGAKKAEQYARLGIETVGDLLWHLPHRYDDFSRVRPIADVEEGEKLSVVASLRRFSERRFAFKKEILQAIFNDGSGAIRATWWNQSWLKNRLTVGKTYRLSGTVGMYMGNRTLENPLFEEISPSAIKGGPILPVYGLTAVAAQRRCQPARAAGHPNRAVVGARCDAGDTSAGVTISSPWPTPCGSSTPRRQRSGLRRPGGASTSMTFSTSNWACSAGGRRFSISMPRQWRLTRTLLAAYQAALPFALTGAQQRVLDEVAAGTWRGAFQ